MIQQSHFHTKHLSSSGKQCSNSSSSSMSGSLSIARFLVGFIFWVLVSTTQAWLATPLLLRRPARSIAAPFRPRSTTLLDSSSMSSSSSSSSSTSEETTITSSTTDDDDNNVDDDDDDDDEEYEYIEYEALTEAEFLNSEWLVGSNWDTNPSKIEETWARCVVDKDGKNVVVWGDNASGQWSLDVASQFFSMSKENMWTGKKIWACTVDDYYYLQGNIRGWNFLQPASVLGQWQARRLGVDKDETGTAPWFQEGKDDNDDNNNEDNPSLAAADATDSNDEDDEGIFKSVVDSKDSNAKSS